jgi:hypothetical protein
MNIFSNSFAERVITVSAEVEAKVSDRVKFYSQNVQFEPDAGTAIAFIARANAEDLSEANKKGFFLVFDKNIKSGTYSVKDQNFPFSKAYYFETGTIPGFTTSFQYDPKSGSFTVETFENSESKLHYKINFDYIGVNNRNEELAIKGTATFIVVMRPM